ncbi:hypothetical protein [Bailinhaonella thermotolerans]|nr:hypothetical protein [Bailinhaonella thermotolerans]
MHPWFAEMLDVVRAEALDDDETQRRRRRAKRVKRARSRVRAASAE